MFNQAQTLQPSYLLATLLAVLHVGALIIMLVLALPWFVIALLLVLIVISLINSLSRYALQLSATAVVGIEYKNNNEWMLKIKQGDMVNVQLQENSYRSLYLVVLNFKRMDNNKKISVVILPDRLTRTQFRRLRAQLVISG